MGTGQMEGNRGQVPSDVVRGTARFPGLRSPWNKLGGSCTSAGCSTKFGCSIRGDFLPPGPRRRAPCLDSTAPVAAFFKYLTCPLNPGALFRKQTVFTRSSN